MVDVPVRPRPSCRDLLLWCAAGPASMVLEFSEFRRLVRGGRWHGKLVGDYRTLLRLALEPGDVVVMGPETDSSLFHRVFFPDRISESSRPTVRWAFVFRFLQSWAPFQTTGPRAGLIADTKYA